MRTNITVPEFDPVLVARYDVAGPRYTSYPTAPQFHAGFDEAAFREVATASNEGESPRPLSLYVHVPFCFSPCFYCGCTRVITRDVTRADRYLDHLRREIALVGSLFDRKRPLLQLHLGGGTPNFLDAPRMERLVGALESSFSYRREGQREYGIEIDPRYADGRYVRDLAALGFNRLSVGIQDFDAEVQVAVNRIQSVAQTREVIEAACDAGYGSVSVDLIYGLPRQTLAGFAQTLDEVIALAPDRIAVYGYAHMPHLFKAQQQIDAAELPGAAQRLALFGQAFRMLCEAGYVYVGMDHFARADDELVRAQRTGTLQRNFQGYSTHGDCDIVGLGVSSISRVGASYSQNARDLIGYEAALDAGRLPVARGLMLSGDDVVRREIIGELMCHGELEMPRFGARHKLPFAETFAAELGRLARCADDGLVTIDDSSIRVTPRGRLLLRNVAMCFDAYLDRPSEAARYSRTI
ncbi:oxygen-independent coproporphyrinogen III oxidase [Dyella kyungheensis]|uniref:Coproporphyrinogen-III oxidase n=1 Tax=Dyella kyungheensis TaxID=1242174 RepID=A0ABS2JRF4_9GAMM|nr:oxygen-independent coproporphyrinogen III oxidase [Dyella kyungheensis]MBM7121612.1 oxygen-independent coproporphyrinogen III oxidase [Dyella kyungheensis]